jgi:peptidoglycan-associated lipoprotein
MATAWSRAVVLGAMMAAGLGLGGCASMHAGRTVVILMPDEDGHVGGVSVSSAAGVQKIDQAFTRVTVDALTSAPSAAKLVGRDAVEKGYADLLRAQPPKPCSFILNFVLDSTALTDESRALFPEVMKAISKRKPTEITVFGHSDASGTERHNIKLSAERARVVADMLRKCDPTLDDIDVQYFGDKVPLVPSDTREPRNRRAEIVIL